MKKEHHHQNEQTNDLCEPSGNQFYPETAPRGQAKKIHSAEKSGDRPTKPHPVGLTLLSRQLQQWVHHQRQLQPALAALLDETRCAPGVPGTDGAATPPGGTHSSAILAATHEEVARILQPTWAHLSALLGTIREVHDLLSADPQGQEQWEHSLREAGLTHLIALALEHETPPPR